MEAKLLLQEIQTAQSVLSGIIQETPLQFHHNLSERFGAEIYLKREDLQIVRSYKLRGAYNKIHDLHAQRQVESIVCASAGNHAQGVAYACRLLGIQAKIFMPITTPSQKVKQVLYFGKDAVEVILLGDTFDDAYKKAMEVAEKENLPFIHPFDDPKVIAGQGTVGIEILEQGKALPDFIFLPIGGGGLASGIVSVFSQLSPKTKIIGVEPEGAPSMKVSLQNGKNTTLDKIDRFTDGAAVKRVGDICFELCKAFLHEVLTIPEGKICSTILQLYNEDAIVVEPAGALSVSALDFYAKKIKGKKVVCVISGGNNDITRMEEIKERSQLYEGLKHYFIINFPQRPGALKEFVNKVLGEGMDISFFEYVKKNNREQGPTLVGIELAQREDFDLLTSSLQRNRFQYRYLNEENDLYAYLIGF
jgi:threonine dehydratase